MNRRPLRLSARSVLACLACLAAVLAPASAAAQRVLGPGPDAVTIPRKAFRIAIQTDHAIRGGQWVDGERRDLGGLTVGGLAAPHLSWLARLDELGSDLGISGLNASLGGVKGDLRQRIATNHLGIEYGVTRWLTLSASAPFVRSRAEAQLRLRHADLATAGANPFYTGSAVPTGNRSVVDRYGNAAATLTARLAACQANAGSHPECPTILAEAADVETLAARSNGFGSALAATYGAQGLAPGLPFVPLAGSTVEQLLLGRVDSLRAAFARYGVTSLAGGTALPVGAQTPLSAEQLAALVTDPVFGYGARPATRTARQDLGDVDVGLRIKLFDAFPGDSARLAATGFGIRQTIGLTYRLGSGFPGSAESFIDAPTGAGHDAVGVRSLTDIVVNERFWATLTLGWAQGVAHQRELRVPDFVGQAWLEAWRASTVRVAPGALIEARLTPRWHLSDYFALGADWRYARKAGDVHTLGAVATEDAAGRPVALNPVTLDRQSRWDEHRFGVSLTYSTLASAARGRARLPLEVAYTFDQSMGSARGILPRVREDRVMLRYYTRFLGR